MGRRPRLRAALDPDQAAALHRLVAAFGAEQVTVTTVQAIESAGHDLTPTTTPAQASLLEEAS
jgi:aspartate-semialdehyde dehydrogenase